MTSTQAPYAVSSFDKHRANRAYWRAMRTVRPDRSASRQEIDAARDRSAALEVPKPVTLLGIRDEDLDFSLGA